MRSEPRVNMVFWGAGGSGAKRKSVAAPPFLVGSHLQYIMFTCCVDIVVDISTTHEWKISKKICIFIVINLKS